MFAGLCRDNQGTLLVGLLAQVATVLIQLTLLLNTTIRILIWLVDESGCVFR